MNPFHSFIFALTLLGCVLAGSFSETDVGRAIDEGNLAKVQALCKEDVSLWEQAVDYVIDTKDEDFVAKFISICTLVMGYAIISVFRKPSAARNIQGKISRYVGYYFKIAERSNPALHPEKLLRLLGEMPSVKEQEKALMFCIDLLFSAGQKDHCYRLLDELESRRVLGDGLRYIFIRFAFATAANCDSGDWLDIYYDHPMITPHVYSSTLVYIKGKGVNNPTFEKLLASADSQDLQILHRRKASVQFGEVFRNAINDASAKVDPKYSRLAAFRQTIVAVKQTLEGDSNPILPGVIADLIASYIFCIPTRDELAFISDYEK